MPGLFGNRNFATMGQMLHHWYGNGPNSVAKADDPVLSTTTGVFNRIFGAVAFNQLNFEANGFGLLPKYPWPKSGFRVISVRGGTANIGGQSEGAALPNTSKPTFAEVSVTLKEITHTFDVSFKQELLTKTDDALADFEFLRGYWADEHAQIINTMLFRDVDVVTDQAVNFESLDRVCCNNSEVAALLNSNDGDIYGLDRDAGASFADAQVDHASGVDRVLTDPLVTSMIASIKKAGGRTNLIITGTDTWARITSLYGNQVRYPGVLNRDVMVQIGINGVQTEEGMNAGMRVASIYGIPLFTSQDAVQDTISRIYFLDTTEQQGTGIPRLGIALAAPTLFFETGMSSTVPNPFAINKLATEGMYYTAGELVCTFFAAQGKIRDLK